MKKDEIDYVRRDALRDLALKIDALEREASALHAFPTLRALNRAKNAAGWEAAGNLTAAAECADEDSYLLPRINA